LFDSSSCLFPLFFNVFSIRIPDDVAADGGPLTYVLCKEDQEEQEREEEDDDDEQEGETFKKE
jgi:hypothetical protein